MSKRLILSIISVIIAFVSYLPVRGQEIIRTEAGDTLITITPPQLRLINCAFSDLRFSKEKIKSQEILIGKLENRIELSDSLVYRYSEAHRLQGEVAERNIKLLKDQIKKERKEKFLIGGAIGVSVGILLGILFSK